MGLTDSQNIILKSAPPSKSFGAQKAKATTMVTQISTTGQIYNERGNFTVGW